MEEESKPVSDTLLGVGGDTEKRHSGLDSLVNPTPASLLQKHSLGRELCTARGQPLEANSPSSPPPKVYLLHLKQESWDETL